MGYFFIARHYRGIGLGQHVTQLLFKQFAGNWEIYYISQNKSAGIFWEKIIKKLGHIKSSEEKIIDGEQCQLLQFSTN